jgi:hypothetical protein
MSINKERPHLIVIPEDDANRQIATGFLLNLNSPPIQILPPVGGWRKVIAQFTETHLSTIRKYPERRILLLLDFDKQEDRLETVKQQIPNDLEDQVFVLGVWSEPEKLRSRIRQNFEGIGDALAADCTNNTDLLWTHELLNHNQVELARMNVLVKPFLFRV